MRHRFLSGRGVAPYLFFVVAALFGGFLFVVPSAYAASEPLASTTLISDANLVSYYPLDGTSTDWQGVNDGTPSNVTFSSSQTGFGEDANFNDASSSNIDLGTASDLNFSGDYTVSAWIKASTPSHDESIVSKQQGPYPYNGWSFRLWWGGGGSHIGKIVFLDSSVDSINSSITVDDDTWHLITVTKGDGVLSIYIDGMLNATGTASTYQTPAIDGYIGSTGGTTDYFDGSIDDVAIFNEALTSDQVEELYGEEIEDFYAQIESTPTLNMYDASSTSANVLKTLPADWIIHVVSTTDQSGSLMVDGSNNTWFKVVDPTDGVSGWMMASSTGAQYISSYDGSSQDSFASSSEPILTSTSSRAAAIVDAVQNYYTNSSTVSSLDTDEYADGSHDLSDIFNLSNATSVPEVLVYGMAAQESGGIGFDNSNVKPFYPAYGYGIMQLTAIPTSSDVYNLEVLLNKNSSTQIEASGPGSPVNETHDFTSDVTAAVENFQTENGISNTGNVFFLTRSALNALLPTSSIPSDFRFNTNLAQGDDDRLSATSSPLGQVSGVSVPPCSNLQDPSNVNYYQDCLGESSTSTPNQYYAPQSNYGNQTFDWYGNTVQSIYSNIKDALGVMRTKWYTWAPCTYGDLSFSAPGFATTTFTCNDRLNILSVWGYNGFATSSYLSNVANQLNGENIQNTFPTAGIPTSTSAEWYNKLEIGQANEFQFEQDSPVDSAVMDSEGRVTGIVNGELEVQIPDSAYDTRTHSGIVLFPQDTYTFRVQGDATGTYGFTVQSNDHSATSTLFHVDNFPTSPGAIHEYSIDFKKLEKGEPGITVKIDDKGNGKIDRVLTDVGTVSTEPAQTYPAPILTAPVIPQPTPAPRPQPPVRIFESGPQISTSTNAFSSSTFSVASSTIASSSSLMNFTSTIEIASSTIETNSSTENNE